MQEIPPLGMPVLTSRSDDELFDQRIRAVVVSHAHASETMTMGKMVDTDLRVVDIQDLRTTNASVFPVTIAEHPQAMLHT